MLVSIGFSFDFSSDSNTQPSVAVFSSCANAVSTRFIILGGTSTMVSFGRFFLLPLPFPWFAAGLFFAPALFCWVFAGLPFPFWPPPPPPFFFLVRFAWRNRRRVGLAAPLPPP